jgi:hypothetical protein
MAMISRHMLIQQFLLKTSDNNNTQEFANLMRNILSNVATHTAGTKYFGHCMPCVLHSVGCTKCRHYMEARGQNTNTLTYPLYYYTKLRNICYRQNHFRS